MDFVNIILVIFLILYFVLAIRFFLNKEKQEHAVSYLEQKEVNLFFWEKWIQEKIQVEHKNKKKIFYSLRAFLVFVSLLVAFEIGSISIALVSCLIIIAVMENKNKKLIDEVGIKHIELLNAFLDSYIPSLASGSSNDQAMLRYIQATEDEDLFNWWVERDYAEKTKIPNKWRRIIEVYEMIKFNEQKGIDNSLPIIEEIQKDINTKQQFFNDYQSKMGETKPIMASYYLAVPLLLIISFPTTEDFWFTFAGFIAALVVIGLFFGSQYTMFKIREKTIKTVF